jgi:hypothetical protein
MWGLVFNSKRIKTPQVIRAATVRERSSGSEEPPMRNFLFSSLPSPFREEREVFGLYRGIDEKEFVLQFVVRRVQGVFLHHERPKLLHRLLIIANDANIVREAIGVLRDACRVPN